jgi:hypothetical protein
MPGWGKVLAWIAAGCALVIVFEFALYTSALTLFTHVDTPDCAGSNTFCSPNHQAGPTGGTIVVIAGNVTAFVVVGVIVALRQRRKVPGNRS